jgi:hypothetical protein
VISTAVDTTVEFLSDAEPTISVRSRPAQHREYVLPPNCVRERLPPSLTTAENDNYALGSLVSRQLTLTAASGVFPTSPEQQPASVTRADSVVAQIIRFESFESNWDGAGAAKPDAASLKAARNFIRALAPESAIPKATLHADGNALLFLHTAGSYAEIEISGDNKIGFYARRGGQEWADEVTFDGRGLPEGLLRVGLLI